MSPQNPTGRRRQQLKHMDSLKLDAICDPAIGTAESILDLATRNPKVVSMILRGTAGKYLSDTMASIAGYRGAPIRKMKNLLTKLCTPGIPYPYAELPPKGPGEEIIDISNDAIRLMPYMRTKEAETLAHRLLIKITELYPSIPAELKNQVNTLAKFDPTYVPPPDLFAQFQEHRTLAEQLQAFIKMPPAGHA